VHGTRSSVSVTDVNPFTMVDTVASWMGLTVSAQREVSPNRSLSRRASSAEYLRRCGSMRIWQRSAMAWIRTPERSIGPNDDDP